MKRLASRLPVVAAIPALIVACTGDTVVDDKGRVSPRSRTLPAPTGIIDTPTDRPTIRLPVAWPAYSLSKAA